MCVSPGSRPALDRTLVHRRREFLLKHQMISILPVFNHLRSLLRNVKASHLKGARHQFHKPGVGFFFFFLRKCQVPHKYVTSLE